MPYLIGQCQRGVKFYTGILFLGLGPGCFFLSHQQPQFLLLYKMRCYFVTSFLFSSARLPYQLTFLLRPLWRWMGDESPLLAAFLTWWLVLERNHLNDLNVDSSAVDDWRHLLLLSGYKIDPIEAAQIINQTKLKANTRVQVWRNKQKMFKNFFYLLIECGSSTLGSNLLNGSVSECVRLRERARVWVRVRVCVGERERCALNVCLVWDLFLFLLLGRG